jgi:hypothetical protein
MRQRAELEMKKASLRVREPEEVQSLMVPMPIALTDWSLSPFIRYGVIGWSDLKLEGTGEIWHEVPVSMMKEREFKEGMDEEEEETERTVELR